MKLIIGLGNPGKIHSRNRHNIGFMCLNRFARMHGIKFDRKLSLARTGRGEVAGTEAILVRPQTYMNSSGQSVRRLVNRYNIKLNDLLVIHDDLDLPLGKIRIRRGGGSGGHKGIDSIIDELESPDFLRLKVGIGRPIIIGGPTEINESEIVDYVLSDLSPNEEEPVAKAITLASEAILCLFADGLTVTMNKYN